MPTLPVSLYQDDTHSESVLIGVSFDTTVHRMTAVRLRASGRGLGSRTEIETAVDRALPEDLADLLRDLSLGNCEGLAAAQLQKASEGVARLVASMVEEANSDGCEESLAVGVADLVVRFETENEDPVYLPVCDTALAAELTGLTVIDSFAARDLAQGGQGHLIDVLARWILLHHTKKSRVLVDLSDVTRLIYLPASCEASGAERVLYLTPGPAMDLWERLSAGPADHLEAPSASSAPLAEQLMEVFGRACERTKEPDDSGSFPTATQNLVDYLERQSWSLSDAHQGIAGLIARLVSRAIIDRIPKTPPLQEMILMGRGAQEESLLSEIAAAQPNLKTVSLQGLGYSQESLSAATIAVLALLHLDQVPAISALHSGINSPRVLGRLTPGSPQNWRRVLAHLAKNGPAMMSLRSAI